MRCSRSLDLPLVKERLHGANSHGCKLLHLADRTSALQVSIGSPDSLEDLIASFVVKSTGFDELTSLVDRNFLPQGAPICITFRLSVNRGLEAKVFLEFFLFKSRLVSF